MDLYLCYDEIWARQRGDIGEKDGYADLRAAAYYHTYWEAVVVYCKRSMTVCRTLLQETVREARERQQVTSPSPYTPPYTGPCSGYVIKKRGWSNVFLSDTF